MILRNDYQSIKPTPDGYLIQSGKLTLDNRNKLGSGKFGTVTIGHLASQKVAVKTIQRTALIGYNNDDACEKEVAIMRKLTDAKHELDETHFCIVQLYGYKVTLKSYYIAMDYMPDGDLETYRRKHETSPLSLANCYDITRDVIAGVTFIHQNNIVHSDIKSANILIRFEDGKVHAYICDFGLAQFVADLPDTLPVGTPKYQPAELYIGKQPNSKASDVYSMTLAIWETMAWKKYFSNLSSHEELVEKLKSEKREEIPPGCRLARLITFGWAQNPDNRPTAREMGELLEDAINNDPSAISASVHDAQALNTISPLKNYSLMRSERKLFTKVGSEENVTLIEKATYQSEF